MRFVLHVLNPHNLPPHLSLSLSCQCAWCLQELWDAIIPKLVSYLKENNSDAAKWKAEHQSSWEELLLKFLSRTLDAVSNEAWIIKVRLHCIRGVRRVWASSPEMRFVNWCHFYPS